MVVGLCVCVILVSDQFPFWGWWSKLVVWLSQWDLLGNMILVLLSLPCVLSLLVLFFGLCFDGLWCGFIVTSSLSVIVLFFGRCFSSLSLHIGMLLNWMWELHLRLQYLIPEDAIERTWKCSAQELKFCDFLLRHKYYASHWTVKLSFDLFLRACVPCKASYHRRLVLNAMNYFLKLNCQYYAVIGIPLVSWVCFFTLGLNIVQHFTFCCVAANWLLIGFQVMSVTVNRSCRWLRAPPWGFGLSFSHRLGTEVWYFFFSWGPGGEVNVFYFMSLTLTGNVGDCPEVLLGFLEFCFQAADFYWWEKTLLVIWFGIYILLVTK